MAVHVIPETEKEKHNESLDCKCDPKFLLDEESGEMIWMHNILDWESLLDDFIKP